MGKLLSIYGLLTISMRVLNGYNHDFVRICVTDILLFFVYAVFFYKEECIYFLHISGAIKFFASQYIYREVKKLV